MNSITKPMLAAVCEDYRQLKFPVLCTPKLDGFRCLKVNGKALTRTFKPVPNIFVREWIEANCPDGFDGELMLRSGTFSETASAIGRESGKPDFVFHVFDFACAINPLSTPYSQRVENMKQLSQVVNLSRHVHFVLPVVCSNVAELEAFEEKCVNDGFEGVMVRNPQGPYKCGRSTEREGYLLKIKRFADSEAVIVEPYEGMTNTNEATQDAFGRTKRSTAQDGMIGRGELGGFIVKIVETGIQFRLGYNHVNGGIDRVTLWQNRESLVGRVVKFKHQPSGAKEAPRFPSFLAFRDSWDM